MSRLSSVVNVFELLKYLSAEDVLRCVEANLITRDEIEAYHTEIELNISEPLRSQVRIAEMAKSVIDLSLTGEYTGDVFEDVMIKGDFSVQMSRLRRFVSEFSHRVNDMFMLYDTPEVCIFGEGYTLSEMSQLTYLSVYGLRSHEQLTIDLLNLKYFRCDAMELPGSVLNMPKVTTCEVDSLYDDTVLIMPLCETLYASSVSVDAPRLQMCECVGVAIIGERPSPRELRLLHTLPDVNFDNLRDLTLDEFAILDDSLSSEQLHQLTSLSINDFDANDLRLVNMLRSGRSQLETLIAGYDGTRLTLNLQSLTELTITATRNRSTLKLLLNCPRLEHISTSGGDSVEIEEIGVENISIAE